MLNILNTGRNKGRQTEKKINFDINTFLHQNNQERTLMFNFFTVTMSIKV
jgi:hypothetical protein